MTLTFQNEQDGILLRDFLRRRQVSASLCAAVKRCGGFFADGAPVRANQRLAAGQTVSFALPPEPPTAVRPQDLPLCIVYEDEHLMVLEKPAGQTVHPTRGYEDGTLANAFLGEMRRRGAQALFRPVNRLDREASGLVLCAMNAWAAPILAAGARKEYLALAQGELPPGPGVFTQPLGLEAGSIIQRCCRPDGRPSRTEYEVLESAGGVSLARCVTVTGRTHQIRVHFAHAGHPLLGDDLYGGSREKIPRVALHCACITAPGPASGQLHTFRSAPPPDMERLIFHNFYV